MPAAPAIIAGVSAAYGIYSGERANQKAGQMTSLQEQALQQDLAARQRYEGEQKRLYGGLEQQLSQEAQSPLPLNYGPMAGAVERNFANAGRGLDVNLARRGLTGSGVDAASQSGLAMSKAGALSQAFNQGLQQRLQLAQQVLGRYNPAQTQQIVSGGLGQLGGFYGQQAGLWGNAAQQGYGAAAQGLGGLVQNYEMKQYLDSIKQTPTAQLASTQITPDQMKMGGGFNWENPTPAPFQFGDMPQQPFELGQMPAQIPTYNPGLGFGGVSMNNGLNLANPTIGSGAATSTTSAQ